MAKKAKRYRLKVHTGRTRSLGNLIDKAAGKPLPDGWIEVEAPNADHMAWIVVGNNLTTERESALGIAHWSDQVRDLDDGHSDASQCFGMSEHLQYKNVTLDVNGFMAQSLEDIKEALEHVVYCAWCPADI